MKSKLDGKIMMKVVGMRPNMYLTNSYLTDDNFVVKKKAKCTKHLLQNQ